VHLVLFLPTLQHRTEYRLAKNVLTFRVS